MKRLALFLLITALLSPVWADRIWNDDAFSEDGTANTHTFLDSAGVAFNATYIEIWNTDADSCWVRIDGGTATAGTDTEDVIIPTNVIWSILLNDSGATPTISTVCTNAAVLRIFASDSRRNK